MPASLSIVLIAVATFSVLAPDKFVYNQAFPSVTMISSVSRGSLRFANIRRTCFVSHVPCSSRVNERLREYETRPRLQQFTTNHLVRPISVHQPLSNFHTSTTLMMGSRKKNGGKSKKVKIIGISKTAAQKLAYESSEELEVTDQEDKLTLTELFETEEDEIDKDDVSLASNEFATEYHAPVMPTECVQALLKQGMWAKLLAEKKQRWRKKRSITKAKMLRLGHYDNGTNDEEEREDLNYKGGKTTIEVNGVTPTDNTRPRLFIDGTLGGGGHSQAILEQLNSGDVLIGCDVDPEALSAASNRLMNYLATTDYILDKHDDSVKSGWEEGRPMFIPVQSNFRNLISVLSKVRHPVSGRLLLGGRETSQNQSTLEDDAIEFPAGANGMLLDLGVSSHQIDTPDRGFAFMKDGPLDMRMSGNSLITSRSTSSSLTAADICNEFDEPSIISILQTFGDEPRARRIASAIVAARPLHSTTDLVHAINSVTPTFARQKRAGLIATSARVFQALRIVVNEEDGALRDVLEEVAPWVLCRSGGMMNVGNIEEGTEGMLVVLSYHSMEDKMAKRVLRDGSVNFLDGPRSKGGALERDVFGNAIVDNNGGDLIENGELLPFEPLGKPQKATEEEIAMNSRARSATLRVGIRN